MVIVYQNLEPEERRMVDSFVNAGFYRTRDQYVPRGTVHHLEAKYNFGPDTGLHALFETLVNPGDIHIYPTAKIFLYLGVNGDLNREIAERLDIENPVKLNTESVRSYIKSLLRDFETIDREFPGRHSSPSREDKSPMDVTPEGYVDSLGIELFKESELISSLSNERRELVERLVRNRFRLSRSPAETRTQSGKDRNVIVYDGGNADDVLNLVTYDAGILGLNKQEFLKKGCGCLDEYPSVPPFMR